MENDPFIVKCPQCGVKNRVKVYKQGKIPVCQRCRTPLIDSDEKKAYERYEELLKQFSKLPDPGGF